MTPSSTRTPQDSTDEVQEDLSTDQRLRFRRRIALVAGSAIFALLLAGATAWLASKASTIKSELQAAEQLVEPLKADIVNDRKQDAESRLEQLTSHTLSARQASEDPIWKMASLLPLIGVNFSATTDIARSADDIANLSLAPLVRVFDSLHWDSLMPGAKDADLEAIRTSAPSVASAADAVRQSASRLSAIDASALLPQVADPLVRVRGQLESVRSTLDAAASVTQLAPEMLGSTTERKYLLLVQNNAEIRATGGIPGALAVIKATRGRLGLSSQATAGELGSFVPPVAVDQEQQRIYSSRLGKFMQDVNLTPDFPTSAASARAMWEKRTGEVVDGVISIDPVALSYILEATGPIQLIDRGFHALAPDLPTELTGKNVVKTLLSDVYKKIKDPKAQDAYFAAASQEIFGTFSSGKADRKQLLEGIGQGVAQHRILLWSAHGDEQSLLSKYELSGSVSGESVAPSQFGVYFNDGTGAKMDYYMKRTVQLVKGCAVNGYTEVTVRITSTNTAPADAASSLPSYVTGGGAFGVAPGNVQTNVVAYGPTQAHIEHASQDGARIPFSSQVHDDRPVGTVTTLLKPGQSTTVDFAFGKIVQNTEPKILVTPTTDTVRNVVIDATTASCNSSR